MSSGFFFQMRLHISARPLVGLSVDPSVSPSRFPYPLSLNLAATHVSTASSYPLPQQSPPPLKIIIFSSVDVGITTEPSNGIMQSSNHAIVQLVISNYGIMHSYYNAIRPSLHRCLHGLFRGSQKTSWQSVQWRFNDADHLACSPFTQFSSENNVYLTYHDLYGFTMDKNYRMIIQFTIMMSINNCGTDCRR